MSRRSLIIAIQAVVVGALVAVVIATVLKPQDTNPLFGVEEPTEVAPSPLPSPDMYEPHAVRRHRGRDRGNRPHPRVAQTRPGGAATVPAIAPVAPPSATIPPATTAPTVEGGGPDQGSPADDQYSDTLTRILGGLD